MNEKKGKTGRNKRKGTKEGGRGDNQRGTGWNAKSSKNTCTTRSKNKLKGGQGGKIGQQKKLTKWR